MDGKLDRLIHADHGRELSFMEAREDARDARLGRIEDDLDALAKTSDKTAEKLWKVAIVVALILGAVQAAGVDLPVDAVQDGIEIPGD
jgi:hypothetical protein